MFLKRAFQSCNNRAILCQINRAMQSSKSQDFIDKWKARLENENVPEIQQSLSNILGHVIGKRRVNIDENITLNATQLATFEKLCECRIARMPIQYIIGQWEFRDMTLKMAPPVFIPRPETEELVELILQQVEPSKGIHFLEIGCGTGAISLALLKSLPKSHCIAIDQSKLACDLAKQNSIELGFNDRSTVLHEKLSMENQLEFLDHQFDLIVSNPPYVKTKDLPNLQPEIKLYEDLRALDGGDDGFNVIKSILHLTSKKLTPGGHLWLEIEPGLPEIIESYVNDNEEILKLKYVSSYQDLFHKERFVEIIKV